MALYEVFARSGRDSGRAGWGVDWPRLRHHIDHFGFWATSTEYIRQTRKRGRVKTGEVTVSWGDCLCRMEACRRGYTAHDCTAESKKSQRYVFLCRLLFGAMDRVRMGNEASTAQDARPAGWALYDASAMVLRRDEWLAGGRPLL